MNTAISASALVFQEIEFHPVDRNDQTVWLTANEILQAIGYSDSKSVNRLYERNKDEFTEAMTLVVNLTTKGFGNGNSEKETRIFSLRGAHLLAMFARTEKAKEFRRWVLDVLDKEVSGDNQATLIPSEQQILQELVARRTAGCAEQSRARAEVWSRIHHKFRVASYRQLPRTQLADVIQYISSMDLRAKAAQPVPAKQPVPYLEALKIANAVSATIQEEVFSQLLSGDVDVNLDRFIVWMNDSKAIVRKVDAGAMVVTLPRLTQLIGEASVSASNAELAALATVCNLRLSQRITG